MNLNTQPAVIPAVQLRNNPTFVCHPDMAAHFFELCLKESQDNKNAPVRWKRIPDISFYVLSITREYPSLLSSNAKK